MMTVRSARMMPAVTRVMVEGALSDEEGLEDDVEHGHCDEASGGCEHEEEDCVDDRVREVFHGKPLKYTMVAMTPARMMYGAAVMTAILTRARKMTREGFNWGALRGGRS